VIDSDSKDTSFVYHRNM